MLAKIKAKLSKGKLRLYRFLVKRRPEIVTILAGLAALGQTSTTDTSSMTQMLQALLPLIMALVSIAIPVMFIKYFLKMIKELLSGFGS